MVTKLGEKGETLRKMVLKTKHNHNVLTQKWHHRPRENDAWACSCRRYFRSILTLELTHVQFILFSNMLISHKRHMERFFSRSWCKRNPQSIQEKNIFLLHVQKHVLHQVNKKALCSMSVLKLGWMSTSDNSPVFTVGIKLSASLIPLLDNLPNNSEYKYVRKIMNIPWTRFLSQHWYHVDCLLLFR